MKIALKKPWKSFEKGMEIPWISHDKIHKIFMGFCFIVNGQCGLGDTTTASRGPIVSMDTPYLLHLAVMQILSE